MLLIDQKAEQAVKRFSVYPKIIVALSGGRDSVCLLDMLVRFLDNTEISAIHVNHHLRQEADEEEKFVKSICKCYGVPINVYGIDVMGDLRGRSVETAAREMRREIFFEASRVGAKVAVAHHALDRAESVLMHILRGSGVEGLVGMGYEDGYIIRPILDFMPEELDEYASARGIKFVTDKTNFDCTYDRNFIRLKVLPLISERYPAVKSLIRLSENASACEKFVNNHLDYGVIKSDEGGVTVKVEHLQEQYSAYKYILYAIKELGIKKDYTYAHISSVINLINCDSGSTTSFLGVQAVREFDSIRLYNQSGEKKCEQEFPFTVGDIKVSDSLLRIKKVEARGDILKVIKEKSAEPNKTLYFDLDKVEDNAVFRFRKEGDKFRPYRCGEKPLKKYFIDKKIPLTFRDKIPLLAVDEQILAVVGKEISEKIKCDETSKKIYSIEIIK